MSDEVITTALIDYPNRRNGAGRQTQYRPELCQEIVAYFRSHVQTAMAKVGTFSDLEFDTTPDGLMRPGRGRKREEVRQIVAEMPTFQRFAASLDVSVRAMCNWKKKYPDFAEAWSMCSDIHEDWFIQGLASGRMPAAAGIFLAKNMTTMRDETSVSLANIGAGVTGEKPPLADRTPAELEELKKAVMAAEKIGFKLKIEDTSTTE